MINCHISTPNPLSHLLNIEFTFNTKSTDFIDFFIPSWRPGRYEIAPFIQNIHDFQAFNEKGDLLNWNKAAPNQWRIELKSATQVRLDYKYFANKMDAGNSVLDDSQCYINFINCIFYSHQHTDDQISISIDTHSSYQRLTSLNSIAEGQYIARDYQELVDCPFIASKDMKQLHYKVGACKFIIAINGECPVDEGELIRSFQKFTIAQIRAMGDFPSDQFIFIIQSLPYRHYHGVEHQNSTVLILGPNDASNEEIYLEQLLGVASHELFHAWNVTRIRPREMSPYCFDKETITKTGFVTEGFTTYFGDYFLKTGGVFSQNEYFNEINLLLKRHFENYGRLKNSLVQSSEDLWVNGYQNLYPSKKASIYVKGALCTLIIDLTIRKISQNQQSLVEVMKQMHSLYTWDQGGYSMEDVYELLHRYDQNDDMSLLLPILYESTDDLTPFLTQSLDYVGLELLSTQHINPITSSLGLKINKRKIIEIAPHSPAYSLLSIDDEILSINALSDDLEASIKQGINTLILQRRNRQVEVSIENNKQHYYGCYTVGVQKNAHVEQLQNLSLWLENND